VELYYLRRPEGRRRPVVASLPHSGRYLPPDIAWQFKRNPRPFLFGTDWHLGRLYDFLGELGVTVIEATHSRYVVDLNRNLDEPIFGHHNTSVIYARTTRGEDLYDVEPSRKELDDRIIRYYLPFHRALGELLEETVREAGRAVLLDLHSFGMADPQSDIVLGDVNGTSCPGGMTRAFETAFRRQDFSVARNDRWTGGQITQRYGAMEGVDALQVELKVRAYLAPPHVDEVMSGDPDSAVFRVAGARLRAAFAEVLDGLFPE
jgi:N-formylglutamate deformylase